MNAILHYDGFLSFIEQLFQYCIIYAKFILGLLLYIGYTSFMWIYEKICYLNHNYSYVLYILVAFCIWLPYSPIIVRHRPKLQIYAKKIVVLLFVVIMLPLWFWWLLPLKAYQKYKFNKELDSFR